MGTRHYLLQGCLASLLLAAAPSALGQTKPKPETPQWEAGIGLGSSANILFLDIGGPAVSLYVPFQLGKSLRLEPSIGFDTTTFRKQDAEETGEHHDNSFISSLGCFYTWEVSRHTLGHFGPRVGTVRNTSTGTGFSVYGADYERVRTAWFVLLGFGGEAMLTPSFSLGAEARLSYMRSSLDHQSEVEGASFTDQRWAITTDLAVFFRVYFWSLE